MIFERKWKFQCILLGDYQLNNKLKSLLTKPYRISETVINLYQFFLRRHLGYKDIVY